MGSIDTQGQDVTYGTDYLSELHDLTLARGAPPSFLQDEARSYLDCLKAQPLRPNEGLVVLDIGTGGGRVVLKLAADAREAGLPSHEQNKYIGIDISDSMLQRAYAATAGLSYRQQFAWENADARKLTAISFLAPAGVEQVDLAMFPISSMCHLVNPEDQKQFLSELHAVLRPETGRAVIAIHDHFIWNRTATVQPDRPVFVGPNAQVAKFNPDAYDEIPSEEYKDVIYRRSNWGANQTPDHQVIVSEYDLQVWQRPAGKEQLLLDEQHVKTVLRPFDEAQWLAWVQEAGLALDHTKSNENMTMYVIKRSPHI